MRFPWISRRAEPEATPDATVRDQRPQPSGNLPRHAQTWTILGLAGLMIMVLVFAGQPPSPHVSTPPRNPASRDDSARAIEEYRQQLDDEQRRLENVQAPSTSHEPGPATTAQGRGRSTQTGAEERTQRAYTSLFADQLAFSSSARQGEATAAGPNVRQGAGDPATLYALALAQLAQPSAQPRPAATGAAVPADARGSSAPRAAHSSSQGVASPTTGVYRLTEGSLISTSLTHRLDGEQASPVTCLVTADVYAPGYQVVLVPAGSWVIGESRPVSSVGQRRLAVVFHRILRPDGSSVSLDGMGTSSMGDAGLRSHVDTHYWSTLAAAGAVGLIAGFADASTDVGLDATIGDRYRQGVSGSLSQSSLHMLDSFLNRFPTITVDEGTFVTVRLLADLDVPPYLPQSVMPSLANDGATMALPPRTLP